MGLVIKLGGSLADVAGDVLAVIKAGSLPALIVPGGGTFADTVRAMNLDDDTAHWQAISAMNRYGVYLASFGFPLTESPEMPQSGISILLPEHLLRDADPLPHSWDVTSDSLALWLAQTIDTPLLLIKSRDGDPADSTYIDSYFTTLLNQNTKIPVFSVNGRDHPAITSFFQNPPSILR